MDDQKCTALKVEFEAVRLQLKTWEKKFAADNGRKPGRDDIKQNSGIGAYLLCHAFARAALTTVSPEIQGLSVSPG